MDLLTTPYVFDPDEASGMAEAGADMIVAHMGLTTDGTIGADTALSLDDCVAVIDAIADAAQGGARRTSSSSATAARSPCRRTRSTSSQHARRPRLLRRQLDGAAADRAGDHRYDPAFKRLAFGAPYRAVGAM